MNEYFHGIGRQGAQPFEFFRELSRDLAHRVDVEVVIEQDGAPKCLALFVGQSVLLEINIKGAEQVPTGFRGWGLQGENDVMLGIKIKKAGLGHCGL